MFKRLIGGLGRRTAEGQPCESVSPKIFLDGAYRLHESGDVERFTAMAAEAFPEFAQRITCFGSDWLGRQFAMDSGRLQNGEPQVLMLEPGTGAALEIPADYGSFHTQELFEAPGAAVAYSFFQEWIATGAQPPSYRQCVGYRVPLFLGGEDTLVNLELCEFEVYWSTTAQVLAKVRNLPVGTRVNVVSIGD